MAGAPQFKVYDAAGTYQAACKEPEAAAAVVAVYGEGSTIRDGHKRSNVLWTEGQETESAAESYDAVAQTCYERQAVRREARSEEQAMKRKAVQP